jgi:hypothetical protein
VQCSGGGEGVIVHPTLRGSKRKPLKHGAQEKRRKVDCNGGFKFVKITFAKMLFKIIDVTFGQEMVAYN